MAENQCSEVLWVAVGALFGPFSFFSKHKLQFSILRFSEKENEFEFYFGSFSVHNLGFPGGSDGKESVSNAGDAGSIPGSGRSPGGGRGNPLQHSCLENSMDRGA